MLSGLSKDRRLSTPYYTQGRVVSGVKDNSILIYIFKQGEKQMPKIGLFYASSTGNTEETAKLIKEKMSTFDIDLKNISDCVDNAMKEYDLLIFGVSTWGEGDLQDDWEDYLANLNEENLLNKTVAIFGLGDQENYCDSFLDAMGTIYDKVVESGATVVGSWPTDGYDFSGSTAVRDEEFVGLGVDQDNQNELTYERVSQWIELITPYFNK
jgi:flavodoxin I